MKKKRMVDGLIKGLEQAVQIQRGELQGKTRTGILVPPAPHWNRSAIRKLRTEVFQMSQPEFASLLNVKPATIRSWEQGQRKPDGAAERLLEILADNSQLARELAS